MYEIWLSEGSGTSKGPRFRLLRDAIGYVRSYSEPGSLAIRLPDGGWHRWHDDRVVVRNRRRSRRIEAVAPCRVCLQPGRRRAQVPFDSQVMDASATGLRVELAATVQSLPNALAMVSLGEGDDQFEVPARVKWRGDQALGMQLMIGSESTRSRYRNWLQQVSASDNRAAAM